VQQCGSVGYGATLTQLAGEKNVSSASNLVLNLVGSPVRWRERPTFVCDGALETSTNLVLNLVPALFAHKGTQFRRGSLECFCDPSRVLESLALLRLDLDLRRLVLVAWRGNSWARGVRFPLCDRVPDIAAKVTCACSAMPKAASTFLHYVAVSFQISCTLTVAGSGRSDRHLRLRRGFGPTHEARAAYDVRLRGFASPNQLETARGDRGSPRIIFTLIVRSPRRLRALLAPGPNANELVSSGPLRRDQIRGHRARPLGGIS